MIPSKAIFVGVRCRKKPQYVQDISITIGLSSKGISEETNKSRMSSSQRASVHEITSNFLYHNHH